MRCCVCGKDLDNEPDDEVWLCWWGDDPQRPLVAACKDHYKTVIYWSQNRVIQMKEF